MEESFKFNTQRGRNKMYHEGFLYNYHRTSADGNLKFWRCENQRKEVRCNGRLHTNTDDQVLKIIGGHTCSPSVDRLETQRIKEEIKRRAANTMESVSEIRNHVLNQIASTEFITLPSKEAMKKLVERTRRRESGLPPETRKTTPKVKTAKIEEQIVLIQQDGGDIATGGGGEHSGESFADGGSSVCANVEEKVQGAAERSAALEQKFARVMANEKFAPEKIKDCAIYTTRGKPKLEHEGHFYTFVKHSSDGKFKFWRCEYNRKAQCIGRMHSDLEDNVVRVFGEHSCSPTPEKLAAQRIRCTIKRLAADTTEDPEVICEYALQQMSDSPLTEVPSKDALKKLVKRVRRQNEIEDSETQDGEQRDVKHSSGDFKRVVKIVQQIDPVNNKPSFSDLLPPVPEDVRQLEIPEEFKYLKRAGEHPDLFLLADSGPYIEEGLVEMQRILIFGRQSFDSWAAEMQHCYMDGTFAVTPKPFQQVYVISVRRDGWVYPVLYVLLTSNTERVYMRMFEIIKLAWPSFYPLRFSLDFEVDAINAAEACFPNSTIELCLFQLVRNLKKEMQRRGLTQRYNTDESFALKARMIGALAFIPLQDMTYAIWALETEIPVELQPILNWFLNDYAGRPMCNGERTLPLFPPELWSVYHRTLQQTDGGASFHVEMPHKRLHLAFRPNKPPTLWDFLQTIREKQRLTDAELSQYSSTTAGGTGKLPPTKGRKTREAERGILEIVSRYIPTNGAETYEADHGYPQQYFNPQPIVEFLAGIARNYQMDQ